MKRTGVGIDQRVERAVIIDLVAAMTAVAGGQQAVVGADLALNVAAELEVVGGFLGPAALSPEVPKFALRRIALENVGRRFGIAPFGEEIEERSGAGETGNPCGAQANGRPAREGFAMQDSGAATNRGAAICNSAVLRFRIVHGSSRCLIQPHR